MKFELLENHLCVQQTHFMHRVSRWFDRVCFRLDTSLHPDNIISVCRSDVSPSLIESDILHVINYSVVK